MMTSVKAYDDLNRLNSISSSGAAGFAGVISSSGYSYNAASQRTGLTNEHGGWWVYQYDALGQVISGK
ncbi:MAG: hypothetical protein ACLQVW_15405, partial [Limisphaerales bacterium]